MIRVFLDASIMSYADPKTNLFVTSHREILRNFFRHKMRLLYRAVVVSPFYMIDADWAMIRMVSFVEIKSIRAFFLVAFESVRSDHQFAVLFRLSHRAVNRMNLLLTIVTDFCTLYLISNLLACVWIRVNKFYELDTVDDYIRSYYFLFATATTIGYGDVTVDHKSTSIVKTRYTVACILIIFALVFYAYVQTKILQVRKQFDGLDAVLNDDLDEFEEWMAVRNMSHGVSISAKFEKNLKDYFVYMLRTDLHRALQIGDYIEKVSHSMREAILERTARSFISKFDFFKYIPESLAVKAISECQTIW